MFFITVVRGAIIKIGEEREKRFILVQIELLKIEGLIFVLGFLCMRVSYTNIEYWKVNKYWLWVSSFQWRASMFAIQRLLPTFIIFVFILLSGLVDCDYEEVYENNYTLFEPLANMKDSQPDGFIARIPVYAIGARDAHIILTTSNSPDWQKDWAYEFRKTSWILMGGSPIDYLLLSCLIFPSDRRLWQLKNHHSQKEQ